MSREERFCSCVTALMRHLPPPVKGLAGHDSSREPMSYTVRPSSIIIQLAENVGKG